MLFRILAVSVVVACLPCSVFAASYNYIKGDSAKALYEALSVKAERSQHPRLHPQYRADLVKAGNGFFCGRILSDSSLDTDFYTCGFEGFVVVYEELNRMEFTGTNPRMAIELGKFIYENLNVAETPGKYRQFSGYYAAGNDKRVGKFSVVELTGDSLRYYLAYDIH